MSWTQVKFTNPIPAHAIKVTPEDSLRRRTLSAGQAVRIELPPISPDFDWRCDTKFIWRIHPEDIKRLTGELAYNVYVCEHQVELD